MSPARDTRWLLSFADLSLVLLAFFVLLHAGADGHAATASVRAAFGGPADQGAALDEPAAALFEPGEAVLRPAAALRLRALGRRLHGRVRVAAEGRDGAGLRLDAWELSAARLAAVARALAVDPAQVELALPRSDEAGPQRMRIT